MSAKVSRRNTLVFAVLAGSAALLAVVRSRGYDVAPEKERALVSLAPWQFVVVTHLARRIAARDVDDANTPTADDVGVADFIDKYIAHMRPKLRADLLSFLALIEQVIPLSCGHASRFTELDAKDQDDVLEKLEASESDLFRGGFEGVKSLIFMGYYRDPRTWKILGYEGPWIKSAS